MDDKDPPKELQDRFPDLDPDDLRSIRERNHMTDQEFADFIGIPLEYLKNWEDIRGYCVRTQNHGDVLLFFPDSDDD